MALDTSELHDLLLIDPSLDQRDLCKQGHHRRRWGCCQAFVAWELLGRRAQDSRTCLWRILETSKPSTVRIAQAAIRSGFSRHTWLSAAGFLSQRKPGSTGVFCS